MPRRRLEGPSRRRLTPASPVPSAATGPLGGGPGRRLSLVGDAAGGALPRAAPSRGPPSHIHFTVELHGAALGGEAPRGWALAPAAAGAYADPVVHLLLAPPRGSAPGTLAPGTAAGGGGNPFFMSLSDDEARTIRSMRMGSLEPLRVLPPPHGALVVPGTSVSLHH